MSTNTEGKGAPRNKKIQLHAWVNPKTKDAIDRITVAHGLGQGNVIDLVFSGSLDPTAIVGTDE